MCRSKITLKRAPTSQDSSGGEVKGTFAAVSGASDVRCDIQPARSSTVYKYAQLNLQVSHTVYLTKHIAALAGDILVSGTRTFLVQGYQRAAPGYSQWPGVADVLEEPVS
jgi:hypothetical protein